MILENIENDKLKFVSIFSLFILLFIINSKAPKVLNLKLIYIISILALLGLIYYFDTMSIYSTKLKIYYFLVSFTILGIALGTMQYLNVIDLYNVIFTLSYNSLLLLYAIFASSILAYYIISFDRFNVISFILGIILIYSYTYLGLIATIILNIIEEKLVN